MKENLAGYTVLASIILILTVDLFIAQRWGYDYTVSAFGNWIAKEFPVALLFLGIVLGHLFWPLTLGKK